MRYNPVSQLVWCRNWIHHCCIHQHDVSLNLQLSDHRSPVRFYFIFRRGFIYVCFSVNRAVNRSNCFHSKGDNSPCHISSNPYMIAFGIVEIILSQIPDFDQIWWLSIVAAVMSFTYSSIGLLLGILQVAGMCRYGIYIWKEDEEEWICLFFIAM